MAYVPARRGKADLTCYREASVEVITIFSEFTDVIERASIDEAYLDVTSLIHKRIGNFDIEHSITSDDLPSTHVAGFKEGGLEQWLQEGGCKEDLTLTVGAMIANEIRTAVFERTRFTCSAGIAYNKVELTCSYVVNLFNSHNGLFLTCYT